MKKNRILRMGLILALGILPFAGYAVHTEVTVREDIQVKTVEYLDNLDMLGRVGPLTKTERKFLAENLYPEFLDKNDYLPYNANSYVQWRWRRNFMARAFR